MLFGSKTKIVPLSGQYLNAALSIIDDWDEDDAEAAAYCFERDGLVGHYVLLKGREVVGISGYTEGAATEGCYWLSWTYVDEDYHGKGYGRQLMSHVRDQILALGPARALYAGVSNYEEEGEAVYERAHHFYQSLGFELVLTLPDYYDEGEDRLIYRYLLDDEPAEQSEQAWSAGKGFICDGSFEILETEGSFSLSWDLRDDGQSSTLEEIEAYVSQAKGNGAQRLFIGMPSDAVEMIATLEQAGFKRIGELDDYYQPGIAEVNMLLTV